MKHWLVLITTGMMTLLVSIDFSIVNATLPTLQRVFSASISELQWFTVGFGATFAVFMIVMGRFADLWGRRRVLYIGMLGFALSSIGAGASVSAWQLIVFRLFQGVFGATIFPSGVALITNSFPKEQHGRAVGIYGGFIGFGLALGPSLGGIILTVASWRWIFFINIPIVIIGFILGFFALQESKSKSPIPIDWGGLIFFLLWLLALLFSIIQGPLVGWTSFWVWGAFLVFCVCLLLFIFCEKKGIYPLFPWRLLETKGFIGGSLIYAVVSFSWSMTFFVPLYLQNVLNYSPAWTSLIFLSMTALFAINAPLSGQIFDKKGPIPILGIIFFCLIFSYILQIMFTTEGPLWMILIAFILFGYAWGGGAIAAPFTLSHLPEEKEGAGTISGALSTTYEVIGIIMLSILGTIFQIAENLTLTQRIRLHGIVLTEKEEHEIRTLLAFPQQAKELIGRIDDPSKIILEIFRESFMIGYHTVITVMLALTILIFVGLAFVLKSNQQDHSRPHL